MFLLLNSRKELKVGIQRGYPNVPASTIQLKDPSMARSRDATKCIRAEGLSFGGGTEYL